MPSRPKIVVVNDKIQRGYKYELTEPEGKNFRPDFQPELSPRQMLELGVFGGIYMRDCKDEFPSAWFKKAKFAPLDQKKPDPKLNFFGVNASQSLKIWKKKGWINPDDPRGWFQWYCRYYMGRRHYDDGRQIRRWNAMKRHIAQLKKHSACRGVANAEAARRLAKTDRPRQRQALLHWAYDSRRM